jgi:excisionase family DNA binding protein
MEPLLTAPEVCKALRISRQLLYALVRQGKLKAYRVARKWRFDEQDVRRYLESVGVGA